MKTKNIIIVFILCVSIIFPQNRWQFVNPLPTGFNLYDINIDSNNCQWIFGEFGTIMKSDNNFETWEQLKISVTDDIYDSEIVNDKFWAVGQNGLILFSDDFGHSWEKQISNTDRPLKKVQFVDEYNGWIIAQDSLVLKTIDGGKNWKKIQINNYWFLNDITFLNKSDGFLLSGYYNEPNLDIDPWTIGILYRTDTGGETWSMVDNGTTKYSSIFFLNEQIGFMSVHNEKTGKHILKTIDSGNSWDTVSNSWGWERMIFINELNGFAIEKQYFGRTIDGGITWEINSEINTPSPSSRLTNLVLKSGTLHMVGTEGNILQSKDFGKKWVSINSGIDFYYASLKGVTFLNKNVGYIYGDQYLDNSINKPIFIKTEDGGKSWNDVLPPDSNYISKLIEFDGTIWAVSNFKLYTSDDNLQSWNMKLNVSLNDDGRIRDLFIFDDHHLIILAGRRVYESLDGGDSWSYSSEFGVQYLKQFVKVTDERWMILGHSAGESEPNFITDNGGNDWSELNHQFTSIFFSNDKIGYAIESSLYKTVDGGNTWNLINDNVRNISSWTSKLHFYNDSIGWLQSGDLIYFSSDGGETWEQEFGVRNYWSWTGSTFSIIDKNEVWAVGIYGFIFKLSSDSLSNAEDNYPPILDRFSLYQNYPNPFNPITNISYTIPKTEFVSLKVYDILGREISNLVSEKQSAGNYQIRFDASNLSSGIYLYRLQSGNFVDIKKLIL
ncbi:MAG: YCF48-related protein, partial [Melioribacteraceae bacterium]